MDALNQQHYRLALILSLGITASLYVASPSQDQQIVILLIFAGLIGVPHGLTDWWLLPQATQCMGFRGSVFKLRVIGALIYLLFIGIFLLFWLFLPIAALSVFLCLSIWHFGLQDAQAHGIEGISQKVHGLLRGASLIAVIYFAHPQTAAYFNLLTYSDLFALKSSDQHGVRWLAFLYVLSSAFSLKWRYTLESMLIMAICILLPPLLAFTLYFCLWHTPRHYLQALQLYGEHERHTTKLICFSTLAILFVVLLYYALFTVPFESLTIYIAIFFKLLAALTFSHVLFNSWKVS